MTVVITDLVKEWVNSPANNFGIALLPSSNINVQLDSKESNQTSHDGVGICITNRAGSGSRSTGVGFSF